MSRLGFLWKICWQEVGIVPRLLQSASVVGPAVVTLAAGILGIEVGLQWWWWLAITVAVFLCLIAWRVFARAYALERSLEPQIAVSDPIGSIFPKAAKRPVKRFYCIKVENHSASNLINCRVKMVEFINRLGHKATETGILFRLSRERHSNPEEHSFTQSFNLYGLGDSENIDIVWLDEGNPESKVMMQYATHSTEKTFYPLPRGLFPHYLTVRVTSESLAKPFDKTFKIYLDSNDTLQMETVTDVTGQASKPAGGAAVRQA